MMSLTTLLAIWGAGLSTYLALWRNRPFAHIRYDEFASRGLIKVSVENRSDVDIIVRRTRVLCGHGVKVTIGDSISDTLSSLLGGHSLVRAGDKRTIMFHLPDDARRRQSYFALISWRRLSGLAAPTFPLVIRAPHADLERLAGGS